VKATNKSFVHKKINELLKVLRIRNDFATICGNNDKYSTSVDQFSFLKSGHTYLRELKGPRSTNTECNNDDCTIKNTENKKCV
jgi:hypothetical protein